MKTFVAENIIDFNLEHIFDCGQCFRWQKQPDGSYTGLVTASNAPKHPVNMQYDESKRTLTITNCTEIEFETFWKQYLDLERDYGQIKQQLSEGDRVMAEAIAHGEGIRILNQDLWETILSFIISQNNNIPRIKGCIEKLAEMFGEPAGEADSYSGDLNDLDNLSDSSDSSNLCNESNVGNVSNPNNPANSYVLETDCRNLSAMGIEGRAWFHLPAPEVLASLTAEDLEPARLGYRARYIIETAKAVTASGFPTTGEQLSALTGVGPKVANCIKLFGMHQHQAFPVDVWMARVMHRLYGIDEKNHKAMQTYAEEHFGELGGFAQQYLFYYIRQIS